ncbi:MAG: putative sulfate exporter family transporter [Burkholderiales bacterium]|nr:putative sulfate exporter family transporter [Burkholderiales bacterium]
MNFSLAAGRAAWSSVFPGAAVALLVGMAAAFLGGHYKGSMLLFALLLGMALNFLTEDKRLAPGIQFVAGSVLRIGVALLGLRLTLENVSALGLPTVLALAIGVTATVLAGVAFARMLGLDRDLGLLAGGATAICGASAALAIASVLPEREGHEKRTTLVVIGVTTLSTAAMVFYPTLTVWLGLDSTRAGIFIGATIHDVAQVVGAGFSLSREAGDAATITKLIRVAFLMPVLVCMAMVLRGRSAGSGGAPLLPWFAVVFALLMLLNSTGVVAVAVQQAASQASQVCLVVAIAAVGLKTSLRDVASLGWRPVLLLVLLTLLLAMLAAAFLHTWR